MSKGIVFRRQIVYIFLLAFVPLLLVNIYIFSNMESVIDNVDRAYDGSRELTEMRGYLESTHTSLRQYLATKDENTLNKFYLNVDLFKTDIGRMDHSEKEGNLTLTETREDALYNLSLSYVKTANMAALAKKSSDIDRYLRYQQQSEDQYSYLLTYITDMNSQMFQGNARTYQKLSGLAELTEALAIVILVAMGVIDILILLYLTKRLTDPLKDLAHTAREVGKGNLDVSLVESEDVNEIGVVNRSFNQMVVSLKDYVERLRDSVQKESALREESIRMEATVKDAELRYLQAQINPHFLFNTLNAGAQLAMLEDADETYKYIHRTANFFRSRIKNDGGISSVGEELKTVDDYIYILNVRYAGEIRFEGDVDERYTDVPMPSMILQPIVENCIKHGFREVEHEKRIDLTVTGEEDRVVISVRDNGRGMPIEVIDHLLHGATKPDAEAPGGTEHDHEGGIGLDNVITRLRGFYNREDVMEITSVGPDMGTEVAIYLPRESMSS